MGNISDFENLLAIDWDKEFIKYLQREDSYKNYFKANEPKFTLDGNTDKSQKFFKLLDEGNLDVRKNEHWKELIIYGDFLHNISEMAHPFFIGFGNPRADTLIINKEKAFDILDRERPYLLTESINNYRQWKNVFQKNANFIVEPDGLDINAIQSQTWVTCFKLMALLKPENLTDSVSKMLEKSGEGKNKTRAKGWGEFLAQNAFLTEIRHRPSRYSPNGAKIDGIRQYFLTHERYKIFLQSFKYVIIGAHDYIDTSEKKPSTSSEKYKDIKKINIRDLFGEVEGDNKGGKIKCYKSDKQTIIVTHQLSGQNWNSVKGNLDEIVECLTK